MAWYLLGYIILGVISTYVVTFVHVITAEIKGYKALEWLEKNSDQIRAETSKKDVIIGLFIWPIRLIEFVNGIPDLCMLYERKDGNES